MAILYVDPGPITLVTSLVKKPIKKDIMDWFIQVLSASAMTYLCQISAGASHQWIHMSENFLFRHETSIILV